MTSFISKDQGDLDFSVHDPFYKTDSIIDTVPLKAGTYQANGPRLLLG